jgi:hypothetical protein
MIELRSRFYDLDVSSAPALVLVAKHLSDFVREATHMPISAGGRPPAA